MRAHNIKFDCGHLKLTLCADTTQEQRHLKKIRSFCDWPFGESGILKIEDGRIQELEINLDMGSWSSIT